MLDQHKFAVVANCWICGNSHFETEFSASFSLSQFAELDRELSLYTGSRVDMRRCRNCGFIQPEALPRLHGYFDRLYNQPWSPDWIVKEFECTYKDLIFRTIISELDRRTRSVSGAKTVLDIGAHVGKFLFLARNAGWRSEGIELNPLTAAYAMQRTGLPVHRINAEALAAEKDRRFTAITLTDVLEHIPDPTQVLRIAWSLLEPAGWVAVKVPCGLNQLTKERIRARLWHQEGRIERVAENLVHINHFSVDSLRLALDRSGFKRITITIGAPELSDARMYPGLKNRVSNVFRRAVYVTARTLPGGMYTPMALNLQAYAQKS